MSENARPHVFVGSSGEGLDIARAIQFHLKDDALVSVWNDGVFGLGEGTLEGLVHMLDRFDFAVLVLTPDDLLKSRGSELQAPRDNVMFELGLFMGRLGAKRTFAVCSDIPTLRLPTDLAGVTVARFNQKDASRALADALGPACFQLRKAVRELGEIGRESHAEDETLAYYTFCGLDEELGEAPDEPSAHQFRERVYRLWADPTPPASHIEAEGPTCVGANRSATDRIVVRFKNEGPLPSDVTIRPRGHHALDNTHSKPFLLFDASDRRPCGEGQVALAVRIFDRRGTQWSYKSGTDQRRMFYLPMDGSQQLCRVSLADTGAWAKFDMDGNHLYLARSQKPDFTVIAAVVVEVGLKDKQDRPGQGKGEIEIGGFRLADASTGNPT